VLAVNRPPIVRRLGQRVRQRREALGISQLALAEAAGLSLNFVGALERGEYAPRLATLDGLAAALRTTASELLRDQGPARVEGDAWAVQLLAVARRLSPPDRQTLVLVARALASRARRSKGARTRT
jgi:transcriptional regulator with XRE-family HTH domain